MHIRKGIRRKETGRRARAHPRLALDGRSSGRGGADETGARRASRVRAKDRRACRRPHGKRIRQDRGRTGARRNGDRCVRTRHGGMGFYAQVAAATAQKDRSARRRSRVRRRTGAAAVSRRGRGMARNGHRRAMRHRAMHCAQPTVRAPPGEARRHSERRQRNGDERAPPTRMSGAKPIHGRRMLLIAPGCRLCGPRDAGGHAVIPLFGLTDRRARSFSRPSTTSRPPRAQR